MGWGGVKFYFYDKGVRQSFSHAEGEHNKF